MQSIRTNNPDLAYMLWTDDDLESLARSTYPDVFKVWNQLLGIQKADLGRYMVLHSQGGFYADTDIIANNSFSNLILSETDIQFAPSTKIWPWNAHTLTNYFMYAPYEKHPYLAELIKRSVHRITEWRGAKSFTYVPKTTGRNFIVDTSKEVEGSSHFQSSEITDMFCASTKIPQTCVAYHIGSTTRSGETWHKSYSYGVVQIECALRKLIGMRGNLSQAPVLLIATAVFFCLMLAITLLI